VFEQEADRSYEEVENTDLTAVGFERAETHPIFFHPP
jgi:hypothetical protein